MEILFLFPSKSTKNSIRNVIYIDYTVFLVTPNPFQCPYLVVRSILANQWILASQYLPGCICASLTYNPFEIPEFSHIYIENTILVSFDIKFDIRQGHKQDRNGQACRACLTCFWSSMINLISKDTYCHSNAWFSIYHASSEKFKAYRAPNK